MQKHCESLNITVILKNLNQNWKQLTELVEKKSQKLEQAEGKKALVKMINDAHQRLSEIEKQLTTDEQGIDFKIYKKIYLFFRQRFARC